MREAQLGRMVWIVKHTGGSWEKFLKKKTILLCIYKVVIASSKGTKFHTQRQRQHLLEYIWPPLLDRYVWLCAVFIYYLEAWVSFNLTVHLLALERIISTWCSCHMLQSESLLECSTILEMFWILLILLSLISNWRNYSSQDIGDVLVLPHLVNDFTP